MNLNFRNINAYLKANPSDNSCGHTSTSIQLDMFDEIGELNDDSFGYYSYLNLSTNNPKEIIIGSYPLQDSKVLKCKICNQVVFKHMNDGGFAPRPEYFLADYSKEYLSEPAVKNVSLPLNQYQEFINFFNLHRQDIRKNFGFESSHSIKDKEQVYLFNYREYDHEKGKTASFELAAKRDFLRKVNYWLLNEGNSNPAK